ncbi:MAG: efflux RND transporter periplasmic adaptor subunit [Gammaproteobacteria bacterium]|uniref:Efflux RND transporter periplasmic adaptor subunit n=1 Tax=SAR86 cluster bacterium TaxID=2030880 RepID=A0A520MTF9_9GAMM|nr:MAG: efflux RND transporter periplasmic adaptor subunit [SAR86 cluster bacterium]|tara:strand:+ start:112 stop:1110 length:999 start_codon:yes stop_codon:yes gene_type:complete
MNKKNLRASAAILFFTVIWMLSGYFAKSEPVKYEAPVEKEVVLVTQSEARNFSLPVTVKAESQAFSKVDIRSQTSEKIVNIAYEDGDFVEEGSIICKLDSGQREANFKKSKIDYDSSVELNKKGLISESALVTAETVYETARIELERTNIKAPFSGFVEQLAKKGQLLQNGQVCASIISLSPLKIVGNVSEVMVAMIKPNQNAEIEFISGEKFNTQVSFISSAADIKTRTFKVEAELNNEDLNIKDGLTGELVIFTDPVKAHFVPTSAFLLGDEGNVALATVVNETVNIINVEILIDTVEGAWITGIPNKTNIVIGGQGFVKQDEEVISRYK